MRYPEDWPAPSMDTVIERTRTLQTDCFGGDPSLLGTAERVAFIRNMVLGLIVEATEALAEVKDWKWWGADDSRFDREKYLEELIDVAHFTHALAVAVGCTDEEWRERYADKSAVVRGRWEAMQA